jgi:hypothetical protein
MNAQWRAACLELARHILPDWSHLEKAAQLTGLDFLGPNLLQHIEDERQQLQAERQHWEQHPDFSLDPRQEHQRNQSEMARLREHQGVLAPFLNLCHGHPRFLHLLRSGYGTDDYTTPFWHLSYYRDRSAAKEIVERTGKRNFAQVLEEYRAAAESIGILQERLKVLKDPPPSPRAKWLNLGRRIEMLEQNHLATAQSRLQLALLREGPIWDRLVGQLRLARELAPLRPK